MRARAQRPVVVVLSSRLLSLPPPAEALSLCVLPSVPLAPVCMFLSVVSRGWGWPLFLFLVFGGSLVFPRGSLYPSEGSVAVRGLPFVFPFAAVAVPLVWPGFRTAGKQGLFFTVAALYQGPNGNNEGVRGIR